MVHIQTLYDLIEEQFSNATDGQKANMLRTVPQQLLGVNGTIFKALGESPEVWYQYLQRLSGEEILNLPTKVQAERLLPLLAAGDTHSVVNVITRFLEAGIFVSNCLNKIEELLADEQTLTAQQLGQLAPMVRPYADMAFEIIITLLKSDDERLITVAFEFFDIDLVPGEQLSQLAQQLFKVLLTTRRQSLFSNCCHILSATLAYSFLEYTIAQIESLHGLNERHPLLGESASVMRAYAEAPIDQRVRFVRTCLNHDVEFEGLHDLHLWEIVLSLAQEGPAQVAGLIRECNSRESVRKLAGIARVFQNRPPVEIGAVSQALTQAASQLLDAQWWPEQLSAFLAYTQGMYIVDDYVSFMIKIEEAGYSSAAMAATYTFQTKTVREVAVYAQQLKGPAKTMAAAVIIRRLKKVSGGYLSHEVTAKLALTILIESLTNTDNFTPEGVEELVMGYPERMVLPFLRKILETASPIWVTRFAIQCLQANICVVPAREAIVKMMLLDHGSIQHLLNQYLQNTDQ